MSRWSRKLIFYTLLTSSVKVAMIALGAKKTNRKHPRAVIEARSLTFKPLLAPAKPLKNRAKTWQIREMHTGDQVNARMAAVRGEQVSWSR